jgi:hypothetical protein
VTSSSWKLQIISMKFILSEEYSSHRGHSSSLCEALGMEDTKLLVLCQPSQLVSKYQGLCLLLRPWFPTCGISLLSGKLRSGGRLISLHSSQTTHDLILCLDKLSTHLIYLLSQEGNRIRSTATGSLSLCFFLDMRILKRIYL